MATTISNVPDVNLGTDEGYRAYLQHVISLFAPGGSPWRIQRTTDTGQIDVATAVQPGNVAGTSGTTGNWSAQPAIFKVTWTDISFYIRMEFGTFKRTAGSTTADLGQFLIRVQMGYKTDGAGNLSEIFLPWKMISSLVYNNLPNSRGIKQSLLCDLNGYLALIIEPTSAIAGSYPNASESDIATYLIISKRPGSGKKTLFVLRGGTLNYGYNTTNILKTTIASPNTVTNAYVGAVIGCVVDLDAGKGAGTDYVCLSTGIANLTNGSSSIGGNTYALSATVPAFDGFYEDPNIKFAYYDDSVYQMTYSFDGMTYMTLKPSMRLTVPRHMVLIFRWQ